MGKTKTALLEMVNTLPDDCSWEDVQYRLNFMTSVENGLNAATAGDYLSHEEAKRKMIEWLQSSGLDQPSGTPSTLGV